MLPLVTYQAEEEEDEADDVCAGTSLRLKGCRHLEIDTCTLRRVFIAFYFSAVLCWFPSFDTFIFEFNWKSI